MNKEQRRKEAVEIVERNASMYSKQIEYSIENTIEYSKLVKCENSITYENTTIELQDIDTVGALLNLSTSDEPIALLNFASYKHPGGGFINGSLAQEECLCHDSTLYNVLSTQKTFYDWNMQHLNHSLYLNRALYSPKIYFKDKAYANVITCAAPNISASKAVWALNQKVLSDRIQFILDIAYANNNKTLILGAFGCGVFGQNPKEVAQIFMKYLTTNYKDKFQKVIFAVPTFNGRDTKNYDAFKEIVTKYCQ